MTRTAIPDAISVVIPTYNSGSLVVQAIESVLAQTVGAGEIVVVDDGSTDDTRARVAAFGGRVTYLFQPNQGVAAARNLGVRQARGDLVAFLDADDVWHPRKLEVQARALAGRPELGLLGTAVYDWPAADHPDLDTTRAAAPVVVPWSRLAVKNYFTTSSVVARRAVLERAGPFDLRLRGPEDYDLWLRIAEQAPVANLRLPLTGYRTVQGSLSKQAVAMESGMRTILEKLDERGAWRGRRLLRRKAYSYFNFSTAYMYRAAGDPGTAVRNLGRSFAWYPLPYRRSEVRMALARPKMVVVTLLRRLDAMRAEGRPGEVS